MWWNDGLRLLFGYPKEEVSDDISWWVDRLHEDDRDRVHIGLKAAAESGTSSWAEDYRFRRRDGTYADICDRGYVMRDQSGTTTRMIGMMQDVSESKQAESKIRDLAYREPLTRLPNRAALADPRIAAKSNSLGGHPHQGGSHLGHRALPHTRRDSGPAVAARGRGVADGQGAL